MNLWKCYIALSCWKSCSYIKTFWLREKLMDRNGAAANFDTSVALQIAGFHSPPSVLERGFALSYSTWRFICFTSSSEWNRCRECRERSPNDMKSRLFPYRFWSPSSLDIQQRCSARNFLLRNLASKLILQSSAALRPQQEEIFFKTVLATSP